MRRELITKHFDACTAAATPGELESALATAHEGLSESEYAALQGRLLADEQAACPKCGNAADGLDLYPARGGEDIIICRKCGSQLRGIDYPALSDYLYGKRNQQAD